jgi:hypothetical protein
MKQFIRVIESSSRLGGYRAADRKGPGAVVGWTGCLSGGSSLCSASGLGTGISRICDAQSRRTPVRFPCRAWLPQSPCGRHACASSSRRSFQFSGGRIPPSGSAWRSLPRSPLEGSYRDPMPIATLWRQLPNIRGRVPYRVWTSNLALEIPPMGGLTVAQLTSGYASRSSSLVADLSRSRRDSVRPRPRGASASSRICPLHSSRASMMASAVRQHHRSHRTPLSHKP